MQIIFMSRPRIMVSLFCLLFSIDLAAQVQERPRPDGWENLVFGGRFMDRFEPSPVRNPLTQATWGAEGVKPRDVLIGIEHPEWSYWGGNVTKVGDTYHLLVARWPESHPKGHMAWHGSDVVRATAPSVWGPYTAIDEIGLGHNPEVYQAKDGSYMLYVIGANYHAPTIEGPWKKGRYEFDSRDRKVHDGFSNFSFAPRQDGSVLAVSRGGDIWISHDGISTFEQISNASVYPKVKGAFEDPVVWKTDVQYHMIVNDWLGRIAWYLRSPNGIDWVVDAGEAYLPGIDNYEDGTQVNWYKYERMRVFQDEYGRATHAFFAVIDSDKRKDGPNDIHSSKNITIPLTVGRRLQVLNSESVGSSSTLIYVKLLAEPNFNPLVDIDLSSLRFGEPQAVDFGEGSALVSTEQDGRDLILTFNSDDSGFTEDSFAGKLLGKTATGKLLFGYSRLPNVNYAPSILSTTLPTTALTQTGARLTFDITNYGVSASSKATVLVKLTGEGVSKTYSATLPSLEPMASNTLTIALDFKVDPTSELDVVVTTPEQSTPLYNTQGNAKLTFGNQTMRAE